MVQLKGQQRKGQGQPRGLSMVKLSPLYLSCTAQTQISHCVTHDTGHKIVLKSEAQPMDSHTRLQSRLSNLTAMLNQCFAHETQNTTMLTLGREVF